MLARDLTLDRIMDISEKSSNTFKNLNLTLSSTSAWGVLRRDLINALGVQRAKRFLVRYGYECGKHEAIILKDLIDWEDDTEWLIAGTQVHNLTGRVFSYPDHFKVDMSKGVFNVSGNWLNSYEASQHLDHFSEHYEPICYFLTGYASGYTSTCFGKMIIFKEIRCKGKGDDSCGYVGKTVEEWGEEISEELFYYDDLNMSDELDQMYQRVEQQKERFETGYSLSQKLNQAMLQGEGFDKFAKIVGDTLNCYVHIEDKNLKEIFYYSGNQKESFDKENTSDIRFHMTVKNVQKNNMNSFSHQSVVHNRVFNLLSVPIRINNQIFGYITVNLENNAFNKDLLERIATVASLYIQNERVAIETEQRITGELLEELLHNKEADLAEIENRFSLLGYNLKTPHYILDIDFTNLENNNKTIISEEYFDIRNKITNVISQKKSSDPYMLMSLKSNSSQVIIPKNEVIKGGFDTVRNFGERILKQLETPGRSLFIGISNEVRDLSDFYKNQQEVKKAIEISKMKFSSSRVVEANEMGYLSLFLNAREPEELKNFSKKKLQPILDYDKKKDSELLKTLYHYSQKEFNLHKTARELALSISGMRYRIYKIQHLSSTDLSLSNDRFEMQIALSILLVYEEIKL
ncbi:XylR N-terminal domain-containing protein [Salicibibacter cibarius]|uniref:XylR N-terminal domain-containing protein n=1 Tax=Salicibibacter cibarius TaxID=2743000 RepID=A0A7T7CA19_9BACI|nr:XylR N-terminal domain-containing protein [Salicibibacter cibarius]QQK74390.1 XylR N-terminal domain-containing protein [Salicibibacter cibarius]